MQAIPLGIKVRKISEDIPQFLKPMDNKPNSLNLAVPNMVKERINNKES